MKKNSLTTNPDVSKKITHYQNLDDNQITIMESKLENILLKHKSAIESGSDWKTPLGIMITIILVFSTADFTKAFLGVDKSTWKAGFIIILIISTCWLFVSLKKRYDNRKNTIWSLIQRIKNQLYT